MCTKRVHLGLGLYRGVALSQELISTKRVYLGLSKVAFVEGWPYLRG